MTAPPSDFVVIVGSKASVKSHYLRYKTPDQHNAMNAVEIESAVSSLPSIEHIERELAGHDADVEEQSQWPTPQTPPL